MHVTQLSCDSMTRAMPSPNTPATMLAGMRSTRALRATLGLWGYQPNALLSQAQVHAALLAQGVRADRVTVYRLLDRLVAAGWLHRTVDAARVTRYARTPRSAAGAAYFECTGCHSAFALADNAPLQTALQQLQHALRGSGVPGHAHIDVAVTGLCPSCHPDDGQ